MARRKRAFLDDESDSSNPSDDDGFDVNENPDTREERELFENPYKRQKRKRTKEDEIYGIFGDEDEEARGGGAYSKPSKRFHFTQAPSFVSGEDKTMDLDKALERDEESDKEEEEEEEEQDEAASLNEQDLTTETPPESRTTKDVDKEEEEKPRGFGGLSSAAKTFATGDLSSMGGMGSKGGIGSKQKVGGLGSKRGVGLGFKAASVNEKITEEPSQTLEQPTTTSAPATNGGIGSTRPSLNGTLPAEFGSTTTTKQRSFLRDNASAGLTRSSTPQLSLEERLHFSKISGSFGAKMLAKMGWQAGTGLGTAGEGIVTPVETKMRPKPSMGLAFKGFKEKTEQSKAEARRRGEIVSEDEEEVVRKPKKGKDGKPKSDAWKKPKKAKIKVEHQTYEQILQNAGQEAQAGTVEKIYDATSGEMREVSSLAEIASWTPSTDTMRIPEVRHNLRLIVDVAKGELDGLAREAKAIQERKKWLEKEDTRLRHAIKEEADLISRLQNVHLIVDEIKSASQSSRDYEVSLEAFSPHIEKLVNEFAREYDTYRLDEIVIGAIAPVVRQQLASWQPLKEPTLLVDLFSRWRLGLKFNTEEKDIVDDDDPYGISVKKQPAKDLVMTPYESLMWNIWLPRIRSSINNEWSPLDPDPVIQLYEAWSTLLPPFIRDNLFDQLVLPKLQKGISDWTPRADGPSLQSILFPWLPHLGLRVEELINEAKRKVRAMLRNWKVTDDVPKDLSSWNGIFGSDDWTSMLLKYIVPKLGMTLREDFKVNPRKQDMTPLQIVLNWRTVLSPPIMSQLLETEFFPKWLDVLHIWLIQPKVNLAEVADWYTFWRDTFPTDIRALKGVSEGFTRGLQLMDQARELGPDAPSKLAKPEHPSSKAAHYPGGTPPSTAPTTKPPRAAPSRITEITFRSIVEEFAASHDLFFMPTGRIHEKSRMPLYRVSRSVDGKGGGLLVYILDDAVWAVENSGGGGSDVRAISLDEMVVRATRGR